MFKLLGDKKSSLINLDKVLSFNIDEVIIDFAGNTERVLKVNYENGTNELLKYEESYKITYDLCKLAELLDKTLMEDK